LLFKTAKHGKNENMLRQKPRYSNDLSSEPLKCDAAVPLCLAHEISPTFFYGHSFQTKGPPLVWCWCICLGYANSVVLTVYITVLIQKPYFMTTETEVQKKL